jgi:tetratricopeptide (TPR) repeat protein
MDDRETYLHRIGELVERAAWRQALKVCDQAIGAHPDCAEAHDYLGIILCRMGRYREALPAYDRAISIEPEFLPALLDKAELLVYHLHEDERAIALTDRVVRLAGQDIDAAHAHYLKGIAWSNLGRHEESVEAFDLALSIDPEYPDSHCEKGVSLFESYRFAEAIRSLKAAAALDLAYGRPHHYLACVYEHLGETDLAQREDRAAAELEGESYPLPLSLSEEEFASVLSEAINVLPREVTRALAGVRITSEWLPDRMLLAEGDARPSSTALQLEDDGVPALVLFQRNLERGVRTRPELVEEIAHAVAHELGHPELPEGDPHRG